MHPRRFGSSARVIILPAKTLTMLHDGHIKKAHSKAIPAKPIAYLRRRPSNESTIQPPTPDTCFGLPQKDPVTVRLLGCSIKSRPDRLTRVPCIFRLRRFPSITINIIIRTRYLDTLCSAVKIMLYVNEIPEGIQERGLAA